MGYFFFLILWQVKQVLPEDFDIIAQFAEVLPAGGFAPAYPFTGFVINLNVTTKLHRDMGDLKFCLVMVVSEDCTGGDLCFLEPGIRRELRHGDMVLFRSKELSHYNMHFKGKTRISSFPFRCSRARMG